ncbi:MAG TPA: lysylphosphatidylglycerol synthase transmembrane domain-containing protein [Gemmataceae bacterium]|nr:lysylphosphatidylglycerol synthase transmembrane domain-containing protein [Gemmataceae bacterium]
MNRKLRFLVSVGLLAWFGWRTDWVQIGHAFAEMRITLWSAAVGLYLLTQIISSLRWQLLAEPLGFRRSLPQYCAFYFIGMYFNLFLPTSVGGDVIRALYLDRRPGQRLAAFMSVFIDRFSGLLVLLALACGATVFCPDRLPPWVAVSVWVTAGGAACGLALLPVATRLIGKESFAAGEIGRKMRELALSFSQALSLFVRNPALALTTTILSLAVQAANVLVVWLVGRALGMDVPASYYAIFVPMVTLLTLVPVSLNGMGVREGGIVLFLAPLGVSQANAVSLAFLWFCVFTVASLCGGAVYLLNAFSVGPEEQPHDGFVRGDSDQGRTGQLESPAWSSPASLGATRSGV